MRSFVLRLKRRWPSWTSSSYFVIQIFWRKHQRRGLLVIEACLSAFYYKRMSRLIEFGSKNQQVWLWGWMGWFQHHREWTAPISFGVGSRVWALRLDPHHSSSTLGPFVSRNTVSGYQAWDITSAAEMQFDFVDRCLARRLPLREKLAASPDTYANQCILKQQSCFKYHHRGGYCCCRVVGESVPVA